MTRRTKLLLLLPAAVLVAFLFARPPIERSLLFFPSHWAADGRLAPWTEAGTVIGYSRVVPSPENVWLFLHGNGGQASDRTAAIAHFPPEDSIFFLEYPGYGNRPGVPSSEAINSAAKEGYLFLRANYPNVPICVVGESLGSGPACSLAGLSRPPDKLVLVVPFDRLSSVARDHYPSLIVALLLKDDWDNVEALSHYQGRVDVFGAKYDSLIPVRHARALAASIPSSNFVLIDGGHGWLSQQRVHFRNP
jgi:hypothetical protein